MAITLSVINGFSKFFHCWKAEYICNKTYIIFPTIPSVCCRTTLWNLEVWNCGNFQKNLKIVSHLTKTEMFLIIWLNITITARSVRLLPACFREDVHATCQLHCQRWSYQCYAKHPENAASVHNTCLDKIVCYLQRIFNRNRKLKQQVSK